MALTSKYLQLSSSNTYYFRLRIPKHLVSALGRREIHRSLKTQCYREALVRAGRMLEAAQRLFSAALSGVVDWAVLTWEAVGPHVRPVVQAVTRQKQRPRQPQFSVIVKRYLEEQRLSKVSLKTISDKESVCELWIRVVGDKPIDEYNREDARKFKEIALQLPPRMGQLPKRSIESMIKGAKETISHTTFNNYVKNLTTVFTFAVREDYCQKNPLEGMKIKLVGRVSQQRSRYTEEELTRLFGLLKRAKQVEAKPHRRWLPILGLYTGARLNELSQLYLDDVTVINGIHCILIRATKPDQKIKNAASERVIPIHSELVKAGFLEFVETQRGLGAERLFPELSLHKRNGYGHIPSRWFAGVRDELGLKGGAEKKDFHSFRHTVADHLKQLGVTESLVGAVLGHQAGGVTFGRYGKEYEPKKLVDVIEGLRFDV